MNSCVQQTGRSGRHEGLRSASSRQVACPASVIPSASGSRLERREETACRQAGIRRGAGLLFFTVHGMGASRSTRARRGPVFTLYQATGARRGHAALRMEVAHRPAAASPRPWKRSAGPSVHPVRPSVNRSSAAGSPWPA